MEPVSGTEMYCDFCNHPLVLRSYDAAPVVVELGDVAVYICDSKWAACGTCAWFIDENRWNDLTDWCFERWMRTAALRGEQPSPREEQTLRRHMLHMHALFREARRRTA